MSKLYILGCNLSDTMLIFGLNFELDDLTNDAMIVEQRSQIIGFVQSVCETI